MIKLTALIENTNNQQKLKELLEEFRKEIESEYDWNDDKTAFRGMCQYITKNLVDYSSKNNYQSDRIRGYYKGADPDYEPDMSDWDLDDRTKFSTKWDRNGQSAEGLPFPHWWVEIDKFIIDVTEDQFHPDEENEYRIGIYKKPNSLYRKG